MSCLVGEFPLCLRHDSSVGYTLPSAALTLCSPWVRVAYDWHALRCMALARQHEMARTPTRGALFRLVSLGGAGLEYDRILFLHTHIACPPLTA